MKSTVKYYLGSLGISTDSSKQGQLLREIVLSDKSEAETLLEFENFILSQNQLSSDTISIINKSLLCGYGSGHYGLGDGDDNMKSKLFLKFINQFPDISSFRYNYADCCMMNNQPVEDYFQILKEGMMQEYQKKERECFLTSELTCSIHESRFSFEFDMILLEKDYLPCDEESFIEIIQEFKEKYKGDDEQKYLHNFEENYRIRTKS
jgi:hypothetical protein